MPKPISHAKISQLFNNQRGGYSKESYYQIRRRLERQALNDVFNRNLFIMAVFCCMLAISPLLAMQ